MDLIKYFFEGSLTFSSATFPLILTIYLHRFCKLEFKRVLFILIIYTLIIPVYIMYFSYSLENLLYQFFALLSSYIYLILEEKYLKIINKKQD